MADDGVSMKWAGIGWTETVLGIAADPAGQLHFSAPRGRIEFCFAVRFGNMCGLPWQAAKGP